MVKKRFIFYLERENDRIPYREDIIINPVLQSPTGEVYQTYLDSYKQKNMLDIDYLGSLTTMPTNIPSSHSFFYLEDEEMAIVRLHKPLKVRKIKDDSLVDPYIQELQLNLEQIEKGGYDHSDKD